MRPSSFGTRSSAPNSPGDFAESTRAMVTRLYIDEVFVKIQGEQHYLWRAVDQDGEVVDVLLQSRREGNAAKRFFKRLISVHGSEPRRIVTDKLRSYGVAHRELMRMSSMTLLNTPTIERSCHISRRESESEA